MRELVEDRVRLGERTVTIVHPPDPTALIDEEAFEREEFLPYWAELWPSGVVLARAAGRLVRPGERVVELGCGLALPSIVATLAGGQVLATDWSEAALEFAAQNAARNSAVQGARELGRADRPRRPRPVGLGARIRRALRETGTCRCSPGCCAGRRRPPASCSLTRVVPRRARSSTRRLQRGESRRSQSTRHIPA